jgi:triosephosphate isomerase
MRRTLIAANWKMHKTRAESEAFARSVRGRVSEAPSCDLLIFPPFFSVPVVAETLAGTGVGVGSQDLYFEPSGAYTGEVSAQMVADAGAQWVLVGHSERRHVLGESSEVVAKKLGAALEAGLSPILCVGERIDEREADAAEDVVRTQLEIAMSGLTADDFERTVIAYEPVWAIGTGKTATPEDAVEMHGFIRQWLCGAAGSSVAEQMRIQYGGSVKPDNATGLLAREEIDGALIGGASLEADSFLAIAAAAPGL